MNKELEDMWRNPKIQSGVLIPFQCWECARLKDMLIRTLDGIEYQELSVVLDEDINEFNKLRKENETK
jgi:hypothetical protein